MVFLNLSNTKQISIDWNNLKYAIVKQRILTSSNDSPESNQHLIYNRISFETTD